MTNVTKAENVTINCPERDVIFSAVGTLGSVTYNCMALPLGFILDKYGTFKARSIATTVITIGLLLLMFVPEVNWLIFPGAFFLFSGTYPLVITNHPLSLLFPAATAVIVTSAQAVFQVSGSVFRIWSFMVENGISFKMAVGLNVILTSIMWTRTFFLLPVGWVNPKEAPFYTSPFKLRSVKQVKRENQNQSSFKTALKYILSFEYQMFLFWVCTGNLVIMFTIISWNYYARELFQDSYQSFVDDFGNWQSLGALFSVMGGLSIDLLSPYIKRNSILESKLICACIIIIIDNCVGIVQNSVQTLRSPAGGFATIVLHNLHRANHFTMAAVYIRCRYPMEVFGTLMGTFRCSMGITVLINVGLNVIISEYENGFNSVVYACIALFTVALLFPVMVLQKLNSQKTDIEEKIDET